MNYHQSICLSYMVLMLRSTSSDVTLNDGERHIALCLEYIVTNYFTIGRSVVVVFPKKSFPYTEKPKKSLFPRINQLYFKEAGLEILKCMSENLGWAANTVEPWTRTLSTRGELEEDIDKHEYFILFVPALEEEDIYDITTVIEDIITDLYDTKAYNPKGKHIVVIADQNLKSFSEIALAVFKAMLSPGNDIYDVLLIIPSKEDFGDERDTNDSEEGVIKTLLLYTWLPFLQNGRVSPLLLDRWIMKGNGNLLQEEDLFPTKIPNKIDADRTFTVMAVSNEPFMLYKGQYKDDQGLTHYIFEGPEIDLLTMICEHMNLSVRYIKVGEESEDYIARIKMALVYVSVGFSDFSIGSLPQHEKVGDWADFTDPYFITGVRWYVPCPRPYPTLQKISETFPLEVWILMLVVLISTALVLWTMANGNESFVYKTGVICLYSLWAVILGVGVPDMPRTWGVRFLFLLFVWYAFIMNTLFQTYFTSYLVDSGIIDQIRSLQELLDSGMEFGYYKAADSYYFSRDDPIEKSIIEKSENCEDFEKCMLKVIVDKNYSSLRAEIYADHFVKTNMPFKKNVLCSLEDRFVTYYISLYLKRNMPFLKRINAVLRRIQEAGIIEKQRRDFEDSWRFDISPNASQYNNEENNDYFAFSISHIIISFYVLAAGCALGLISFIVELIFSRIKSARDDELLS